MKKERLFIFWLLAIIVASVLLIFLKPQETINNIIQAIAIITLIFVTWVYAKRTKDLVDQEKISLEEEKKRRDAEHWEKRINEFFMPFIEKISDIRDGLHKSPIDTKKMNELTKNTQYFFWHRGWLISKETFKKIEKLEFAIFVAVADIDKESLKRFHEAEKEVRKIIVNDWKETEDKLRKFHGY